jgi:hypothetical protein
MRRASVDGTAKVFLLLALVPLFSAGCATTSGNKSAKTGTEQGSYEERWGVEPLGVQLSAAGYMLDFRLKVLDPGKAAPLLVRKTKSHLIVEKTGAVFQVASSPKIGALRATVRTEEMVKQDRIYGTLFANPGRYVKTGDRVTVVMGEMKVEHLVVQ